MLDLISNTQGLWPIISDVGAAFKPAIVPVTIASCAIIIGSQFASNSRLRTANLEMRIQTETANAAIEFALRETPTHEDEREFLWYFRFAPAEVEQRFPRWTAYQKAYVEDAMRSYP
jgi:hypothetical protein